MASTDIIYDAFASAEALGRAIGVPGVTVRQWRNRGRGIPPKYWKLIRHAARALGKDLPIEVFLPDETLTLDETDPLSTRQNRRAAA